MTSSKSITKPNVMTHSDVIIIVQVYHHRSYTKKDPIVFLYQVHLTLEVKLYQHHLLSEQISCVYMKSHDGYHSKKLITYRLKDLSKFLLFVMVVLDCLLFG